MSEDGLPIGGAWLLGRSREHEGWAFHLPWTYPHHQDQIHGRGQNDSRPRVRNLWVPHHSVHRGSLQPFPATQDGPDLSRRVGWHARGGPSRQKRSHASLPGKTQAENHFEAQEATWGLLRRGQIPGLATTNPLYFAFSWQKHTILLIPFLIFPPPFFTHCVWAWLLWTAV